MSGTITNQDFKIINLEKVHAVSTEGEKYTNIFFSDLYKIYIIEKVFNIG